MAEITKTHGRRGAGRSPARDFCPFCFKIGAFSNTERKWPFTLWHPGLGFRPEPDFLSGAGTGLSRSPAPRKRNATTQTTHTALRRGSCCTLCSRLRPQLRRWKAASEAPQRGRGRRMRFCYSQLELAALPEVEGDAQKNDILTGRVSPKLALDATKEGGS